MSPAATKKKAASKKAAPKKVMVDETPEDRRAARQEANDALMAQIKELREDDGKKWGEIAEELEISTGKAMFLYECAKVAPKDRIKYKDDDDLAKQIVAARKQGQAWGTIMARAQIGEGKARSLYTEATGEDTKGLKVGRGGRPAAGETPKGTKANRAEKATKKAVEKRQETGPKHVTEMNISELRDRCVGKVITVGGRKGNKEEKILVKSIQKLDDGTMHFTNGKGQSRVVGLDEISKITR